MLTFMPVVVILLIKTSAESAKQHDAVAGHAAEEEKTAADCTGVLFTLLSRTVIVALGE